MTFSLCGRNDFIFSDKEKRRGMNPEEYEDWKRKYKGVFGGLRIARKYAQFQSLTSGLREDGIVELTCPLHNVYDCGKCQLGVDLDRVVSPLHGYNTFSPEVSCLIGYMLRKKFMTLEEISVIVNDGIVLFREEHLLHYLYMHLANKGTQLPRNVVHVFRKYRKYLLYWFLSYRSPYSMFRAQYPPVWCDFVSHHYQKIFRRPCGQYINNLSQDFRRYDNIIRFDFNNKQFIRSRMTDLFFPVVQHVGGEEDDETGEEVNLLLRGPPMVVNNEPMDLDMEDDQESTDSDSNDGEIMG